MKRKGTRFLTVPFGLRDGRFLFVNEVPSGIGCGCVCPECGMPLIARNREFEGRQRARHFQHARATACRGGWETAVHRMAKAVLADAGSVILPRWTSGDIEIEPSRLAIADSRLEVSLLDGGVRADVVLRGAVDEVELMQLCVEIRVHHAVDTFKREALIQNGVDAIEIDLSRLNEEAVADSLAFRKHVLDNDSNRHWVNLATARYVADRAARALIEVEDSTVTERVITTKAGRPFTIREQWAYLVKPGSREPVRLQIPDETVGEEALPYPRGLHSISARSVTVGQWGRVRLRYKIYLDQIEMNPPDATEAQIGLFEDQNIGDGPGFRVRQRKWKGTPGL